MGTAIDLRSKYFGLGSPSRGTEAEYLVLGLTLYGNCDPSLGIKKMRFSLVARLQ